MTTQTPATLEDIAAAIARCDTLLKQQPDPDTAPNLAPAERRAIAEKSFGLAAILRVLSAAITDLTECDKAITEYEEWRGILLEVRQKAVEEHEAIPTDLRAVADFRERDRLYKRKQSLVLAISTIDRGCEMMGNYANFGCLGELLRARGVTNLPEQPTLWHGRHNLTHVDELLRELQQKRSELQERIDRTIASVS